MALFCSVNPLLGLRSCPTVPFVNRHPVFSCFAHEENRNSLGKLRRSSSDKSPQRAQCGSVKCEEKSSDISDVQDREHISQATLIWRAIKLPIYSVAVVPLTVASAAAYLQTGQFFVGRYLSLLISSILIITWLNLSNDVYDFDTGADKDKKESVVNIIRSRTGTLVIAYVLLAVGLFGLVWVAFDARNTRSILLLFCAVMCGYVYQCPPFRLSYQGLGEPLCFASFGPFATTAFYLMQISSREACYKQPMTSTVFFSSVLVGFTTTLILFCSHFHQVEGDRAVGKFSPLVRVGRKAGSEAVKVAVAALYSVLLILGLSRALPFTSTVLCSLTLPIGNYAVNYVKENYHDNEKIFMAKYFFVRLHALFGVTLAMGLVLARRFCEDVPRPIVL